MKTRKLSLVKLLLFMLGVLFYAFAVVSTFTFGFYTSNVNPSVIFILTSIGGLGALGLGYASVVILGGKMSLWLNEFIARVTICKQVVEVTVEKPQMVARKVAWRDFLLYMPALANLRLRVIILGLDTVRHMSNLTSHANSEDPSKLWASK